MSFSKCLERIFEVITGCPTRWYKIVIPHPPSVGSWNTIPLPINYKSGVLYLERDFDPVKSYQVLHVFDGYLQLWKHVEPRKMVVRLLGVGIYQQFIHGMVRRSRRIDNSLWQDILCYTHRSKSTFLSKSKKEFLIHTQGKGQVGCDGVRRE